MQPDKARSCLQGYFEPPRDRGLQRTVDAPFRGLDPNAEQLNGIDIIPGSPRRRGSKQLNPVLNEETDTIARRERPSRRPSSPLARTRNPKDRFLIILAQTGNVTLASKAAGLERRHVEILRRDDHLFSAAFDDALEEAADLLEAEAWRRAVEGITQPIMKAGRPVIDPGSGRPLMATKYNDALLMLLLRAARPQKFNSRSSGKMESPGAFLKEIVTDDDPPVRESERSA